jgi:hypothetical protein
MTLAITALATVPALVRVRRRVPARLLRDE